MLSLNCMCILYIYISVFSLFRINEIVIDRIIQDMADISTPLKQVREASKKVSFGGLAAEALTPQSSRA